MELFNLLKGRKKEDIFRLNEKHNGILYPDKTLYLINESDEKFGFFATYRNWLEYLYFADICGYIPVIDAGMDSAYREDKPVRNTYNVFEYYFKQPASIRVSEVQHSNHIILSDIIHREMVELVLNGKRAHYGCNIQYKHLMAKIVHKYLKYNNTTQQYLDEGLKSLPFGKEKILGVHIRGTDFRKKYDSHPVFITEKDCFVAIENIMGKNKYSKIFIATDDENILTTFVNQYSEKICYYQDVMRSKDKKSVIFHKNIRDWHKYKSGLEVIRDMYTLSCCDGLVAGVSQVAICAQLNKLARKEKYEDMVIIDKGIYKNGHYFKV